MHATRGGLLAHEDTSAGTATRNPIIVHGTNIALRLLCAAAPRGDAATQAPHFVVSCTCPHCVTATSALRLTSSRTDDGDTGSGARTRSAGGSAARSGMTCQCGRVRVKSPPWRVHPQGRSVQFYLIHEPIVELVTSEKVIAQRRVAVTTHQTSEAEVRSASTSGPILSKLINLALF